MQAWRELHWGWGLAAIVALVAGLYGVSWAVALAPYALGWKPTDAELRRLIDTEGAALVNAVRQHTAEHGRYPTDLAARELPDGAPPTSDWQFGASAQGVLLSRELGPGDHLVYYFESPQRPPGWYRFEGRSARPLVLDDQ
jgi:hypothetical protein